MKTRQTPQPGKRKWRGFGWVSMIVLCAVNFHAYAEETPTFLTLGDSITEGGKNFVCYRQVLIPELRRKNVAVQFIGPKKDATSAHAGYSGKNTSYLLSISKQVYSEYPADIVMLHSGHNSFSDKKPVPGIIRDTEAIIDNIREINPEVQILLAQVIPAGKLPKYSYIPELNKELKSLSARLVKKGVQVTLVDHEKGFDWKTDTVKDKVHPSLSGAKKMSDKWIAALLPSLGHPEMLAYKQFRLWDGAAPGVAANPVAEKDLARGRASHVSVPMLERCGQSAADEDGKLKAMCPPRS